MRPVAWAGRMQMSLNALHHACVGTVAGGLAGGELLHGLAHVLVRIHRRVVDADLVVEVRAGGTAYAADVADDFAAVHILAGGDGESGEMAIESMDAVAVIEDDFLTVAAGGTCHQDGAVGRGADWLTHSSGDIDALVEGAFAIEGVLALAEGAGDGAFDRPEVGQVGGGAPIGAVAEAEGGLKGAAHVAGERGAAQGRELVERMQIVV